MSRKRHRDQILCQILRTCQDSGASKTKIVYQSNMNFRTIVPYIDLLIENELIEKVDGFPTEYYTTSKGLKTIKCLNELEELIPRSGIRPTKNCDL